MSAIIANYELIMKDGANPSTSTASTDLNADRCSEIIPLERSFMGEIDALCSRSCWKYDFSSF